MRSSVDPLWFSAAVFRAAPSPFRSRALRLMQLVGSVVLLSLFFSATATGPDWTWPRSVATALATWVPAGIGVLFAGGLNRLIASPAFALAPGLARTGRLSGTLVAAAAAAVAAGSAQWLGTQGLEAQGLEAQGLGTQGSETHWSVAHGALAAGAFALTAYAYGLILVLGTRARAARSIGAFVLFQATVSAAQLGWLTESPWRSLAAAGVGACLLYGALWRTWPHRASSVESSPGSVSAAFPEGASPSSGLSGSYARLSAADRFRQSTPGSGSRTKILLTLFVIVVGPLLMLILLQTLLALGDSELSLRERLYRDLIDASGSNSARSEPEKPWGWTSSSMLLIPLIMAPIFATSQHAILGTLRFSRRTLARFAFRRFVRDMVAITAVALVGMTLILGAMIAILGLGMPERLPSGLAVFPFAVAMIPWLSMITLRLQRGRLGAPGAEGLAEFARSSVGMWLPLALGMMTLQLGVRWLMTDAPELVSAPATLLALAAATLMGVALLPSAFRRYYDRASLEP